MRIDLYRETPCQHGYAVEHVQNGFDSRQPPHDPPNHVCPGGSREEVVIDYEAATQALAITHVTAAQLARFVVDAALYTERATASTA